MRTLLFWASLPFVFPQGLKLYRNPPDFSAAIGPNSGKTTEETPNKVIGIGDSIIAGVGVPTLDKSVTAQIAQNLSEELGVGFEWEAIGRIGATSEVVRRKLIPNLPAPPVRFVFLSVGVNDITRLKNLGVWRKNLDALLQEISEYYDDATIALLGIPPIEGFPVLPKPLNKVLGLRAKMFEEVGIEVVAKYSNAVHIPMVFDPMPDQFSPDGFHPNQISQEKIASEVVGVLKESGRLKEDA